MNENPSKPFNFKEESGVLQTPPFFLPVLLVLGFFGGIGLGEVSAEEIISGEGEYGPSLRIQGFADVNYISEEPKKGVDDRPNSFSLGQVDLFVTSELTQKSSFLSEIVLEGTSDNETEIDLERMVVEYAYNSLFQIKIGRMHTAISYWNTEYHHGRWFHTTVFRPKFYGWEDERGFLPSHMVGVFLHGKKEADRLDLTYGLGLANGRGKRRTEIQAHQDANEFKAVNGHLRLSSNRLPGLLLGFNGYVDRIPEDDALPIDPARAGEIRENIWGGYMVYERGGLEFINEYTRILHKDEVSDKKYVSRGYYLQLSFQKGTIRPYYRLEYSSIDEGDPYWTDLRPLFDDYTANIIGLRLDLNLWSTLKIEYRLNNYYGLKNSNDFYVQSAFTF